MKIPAEGFGASETGDAEAGQGVALPARGGGASSFSEPWFPPLATLGRHLQPAQTERFRVTQQQPAGHWPVGVVAPMGSWGSELQAADLVPVPRVLTAADGGQRCPQRRGCRPQMVVSP